MININGEMADPAEMLMLESVAFCGILLSERQDAVKISSQNFSVSMLHFDHLFNRNDHLVKVYCICAKQPI